MSPVPRIPTCLLRRAALHAAASSPRVALADAMLCIRVSVLHSAGGMLQTFVGIIRNEGPQGLYTGCLPALVGMAPAGSIFYGVFDLLKHRQLAALRSAHADGGNGGVPAAAPHLDALQTMAFGAIAGMCSELVVYPLEVVRRRMQLQSMAAAAVRGGMRGHPTASAAAAVGAAAFTTGISRVGLTIQEVWRADGLHGFYAGMKPNLLQVLPSSALSYFTYETLKEMLALPHTLASPCPRGTDGTRVTDGLNVTDGPPRCSLCCSAAPAASCGRLQASCAARAARGPSMSQRMRMRRRCGCAAMKQRCIRVAEGTRLVQLRRTPAVAVVMRPGN
eukprot:363634-Chlamydomonas_euryale.AAC.17